MTHPTTSTLAHRLLHLPLAVLLAASLAGCPYIGAETHEDNLSDDDSEDIDDDSEDIDDDSDTEWDTEPDTGPVVIDDDNDGVEAGEDCDDNDPNNYPGNTEVCDGSDNDCDVDIDEGFPALYLDLDDDGYGGLPTDACNTTDPTTEVPGDCDDSKNEAFPTNPEVCDGVDNDCNDFVDDGLPPLYADRDRDGYGTGNALACDTPLPTSTEDGDCDDSNGNRFPGNVEVCDEVDNDCQAVTADDGIVTLYPGNGNPVRNLAITPGANTVISGRTDNAEVRFCEGDFAMTFVFQNNTGDLLMSGLGRVDVRPRIPGERVFYIENSTVELNNMTVAEGSFDGAGAGLFCTQSTLILNAVAFNENIGTFGSAFFADGCDVSGSQVQFVGNDTNEVGGSIVHAAADSTVTFDDALWRNNTGDLSFVLANSDGFLTDLVMNDNTGGGIRISGEAVISVTRGDFSGNNGTDILFSNNEGFNQGTNSTITCTSPGNSCVAR